MTDQRDDDGYEVGYKRPPKHTQFRKGESGRSRARKPSPPKVAVTQDEVVRKAAARLVKMREGDASREVPISQALIEKAINLALSSNNLRHIMPVIEMVAKANAFGERELTVEEADERYLQENRYEIDALREELAKYWTPGDPNGEDPDNANIEIIDNDDERD